ISPYELAGHVKRKSGTHYEQLKKDLESFFRLVRSEDDRLRSQRSNEGENEFMDTDNLEDRWKSMASEKKDLHSGSRIIKDWPRYANALDFMGISYEVNKKGQISGLKRQ
ncbi:MAG: hypothetical protein OEY59_13130, partial [Deltaproteobacteria bacterium]|nr:hypothetical protein [Deltaproteobacteria bacterium]